MAEGSGGFDIRGELSLKAEELACAGKSKVDTMFEVATFGDVIRVCRSERKNKVETSALKVARLQERIQDLEAQLTRLNKQVVALKTEEV